MNNYYEEIYFNIKELINGKQYLKAKLMIEDELSMPYIPNDFEIKLQELLDIINQNEKSSELKLNDDEILEYLHSDEYKQIVAVNYLDSLNLRDYLDVVQDFLMSNGSKEAKSLLISSLINQDINQEITMLKDNLEISFIPRYVESIEISDGYVKGLEFISDIFENDNPSLYNLAKDLLIKECFLELPFSFDENEGLIIAKRIIIYLYDCLMDEESKNKFIDEYVSLQEKEIIMQKNI